MPSPKSKRARKRRHSQTAPRAVASTRRAQRARQASEADDRRRRASRRLGAEGERPPGLFGGVPVSEVAIFAGLVAAVVGFVGSTTLPLAVGLVVCGLGVMEVTGREHFSGYRSHAALLAAIPAVGLEAAVAVLAGRHAGHGLPLLAAVPVFGILFWALRHQFMVARQARVARSARGTAPPVS